MTLRCSPSGEYRSRSYSLLLLFDQMAGDVMFSILLPSDSSIRYYTGLLHIVFVVLRRHQFERNPGVLFNRFAFRQGNGNLNATFALSLRVLEDGDIQPFL